MTLMPDYFQLVLVNWVLVAMIGILDYQMAIFIVDFGVTKQLAAMECIFQIIIGIM